MRVRHFGFVWVAALLLGVGVGCHRSSDEAAHSAAPVPPPSETIARFDWLGKERIAADTNSAHLMQIWREPESVRLEAQTLDKLAAFPWRSASTNSDTSTNSFTAPQQALRTLLQDVLLQECHMEVRQTGTNSAPEVVFAIRLEDPRANLWQTKLAVVLESLTGTRPTPTPSGWALSPSAPRLSLSPLASSRVELTRVKGWILVAFSSPNHPLITDPVSVLSTFQESTNRSLTNSAPDWLVADFDPYRLAAAVSPLCKLPDGLPAVSLAAFGDGDSVRTRGEFRFSQPLPLILNPWTVPTNLVGRTLIGFTALRGIKPLLKDFRALSGLRPESVPDQAFTWDEDGPPFQLWFALAAEDVKPLFDNLACPLPKLVNPRLPKKCGSILVDTNAGSLDWSTLGYCSPFISAITNTVPQWLYGGFVPHSRSTTSVMPVELLDHLRQGTNLVYYDFELTGKRLIHYRYLDDVYRLAFDTHGPRLGDTASIDWIAANMTSNLLFAATEVRREDERRLSFARKSSIGLTGLEINLAANWLELPEFPCGLSTLLQTNGAPLVRKGRLWQMLEHQRQATNAALAKPPGQ